MISLLAQALLHSLWQIGLLAVLLMLALKLVSRQNSQLRSLLSLGALYAAPVLFIATYAALSLSSGAEIIHATASTSRISFEPYIVWLWLIGALVPASRLLKHRSDLNSLLNGPMTAVPSSIEDQFQKLIERFEISRTIQLFLSDRVPGACTAAFWRPIILLPPAYLANLSIVEIEAIIAHELAHIKRHDGLHRILQILIEAVFYYHPCLSWISRQVSLEREHACDDLAVKMLGDKQNLATGLLKAKLVQVENDLLLAARSGSYQELDIRIRRLIPLSKTAPQAKPRSISLSIIALIFVIVGGVFAASSWSVATANNGPRFSRAVLVSLKNDVCDHIGLRELYWTSPFNRSGAATVHLIGDTVFMNENELPAEDQAALKTVFKRYKLSSYENVKLRYFGDDVKLIVSDYEGENSAPYVYISKSGSNGIDTFRLPRRSSS